MPLLFITSYSKTYSSNPCSLASIAALILLICVIIIPYYICHTAGDFWSRISHYYENPTVTLKNFDNKGFKEDFIFFSEESNSDKIYIPEYLCDEFKNINKNGDSKNPIECGDDKQVSSKSIEVEEQSLDGKTVDKIKVTVDGFNDANKLKMLFFITYGLKNKVKFIMNSLIYIDLDQYISNYGEIYLKGTIELKQREPISNTGVTDQSYYYTTYFNGKKYEKYHSVNAPLAEGDCSPLNLLEIFKNFRERKYITDFNFEIDEINSNRTVVSGESKQIVIEMEVPKYQKVIYYLSYFELIKNAWVQYIYLLIPFMIILFYFLLFILKNQVFSSYVTDDLPFKNK